MNLDSEETLSKLRQSGFEGLNDLLMDIMLEFEKDREDDALPPALLEICRELERAVVEGRWGNRGLETAVFALGKTVWKSNGPSLVALVSKVARQVDDPDYAYQWLIAVENDLETARVCDLVVAERLLEEFSSRPNVWSRSPGLFHRVVAKLGTPKLPGA